MGFPGRFHYRCKVLGQQYMLQVVTLAAIEKRLNHHILWKFGKSENPCFHPLPGNPVHSLLKLHFKHKTIWTTKTSMADPVCGALIQPMQGDWQVCTEWTIEIKDFTYPCQKHVKRFVLNCLSRYIANYKRKKNLPFILCSFVTQSLRGVFTKREHLHCFIIYS